MTYENAIQGRFTYYLVKSEIEKHGESMENFITEFGVHTFYNGSDVLEWLGY